MSQHPYRECKDLTNTGQQAIHKRTYWTFNYEGMAEYDTPTMLSQMMGVT